MSFSISTHAEIPLLELLKWKPGPKGSPKEEFSMVSKVKHVLLLLWFFFISSFATEFSEVQLFSSPWNHFSENLHVYTFPAKVTKHSNIDPHTKHILFDLKTLLGHCFFNGKPTVGNVSSSRGFLPVFGIEISLGSWRGIYELWHPGCEIYKLWLPSPQRPGPVHHNREHWTCYFHSSGSKS